MVIVPRLPLHTPCPERDLQQRSREPRDVCLEEFGHKAVERTWSFQICQVAGTRNHVMKGVRNHSAHECVYRNTRLVMLSDDQQHRHLQLAELRPAHRWRAASPAHPVC
jgi:hypothetical protein